MADDLSPTPGIDAAQEVIRLWPEGPPRAIPDVGPEASYVTARGLAVGTVMLRNVTDPTLTVFRPNPAKANGVGVIICPGGGWRILAWTHEGLDLARWLAMRGYTAFLLKYRVKGTPPDADAFAAEMAAIDGRLAAPQPAAKVPRTLAALIREDAATEYARQIAADDGRRAAALVRERAADWGLKTLGMIGFSAGAFLAADVATDPKGPPLDFVAPIYGGDASAARVPPDAPPLFTVVAQDDRMLFKVVEGLYADWTNADRPAEMHVFARGSHGFGMVRQGLPVDRWTDLFGDWLADQGFA
jgi:acetyl esterase/lipase